MGGVHIGVRTQPVIYGLSILLAYPRIEKRGIFYLFLEDLNEDYLP
jgi:hypothetical protein